MDLAASLPGRNSHEGILEEPAAKGFVPVTVGGGIGGVGVYSGEPSMTIRTTPTYTIGTMIYFAIGLYSNWEIVAWARVKKPWTHSETLETYLAGHPNEAEKYGARAAPYITWLGVEGYIDVLDVDDAPKEVNLFEYSTWGENIY